MCYPVYLKESGLSLVPGKERPYRYLTLEQGAFCGTAFAPQRQAFPCRLQEPVGMGIANLQQ
jgi:hypothetical protein